MAHIRRKYDDATIIKNLYNLKTDLNFGDEQNIRDITVEPATASPLRAVTVTVTIPVTEKEFAAIFVDPIG